MTGCLHTYNLAVTQTQNHKTGVLSTNTNGPDHFNVSKWGAYGP